MHYKEILTRLTGISVPIFGLQWNPPIPEVTIARRVIRFLEDRRVLYNLPHAEEISWCIQSVIEIRHLLTSALTELSDSEGLALHLQAMRAACRKFLDQLERYKVEPNIRGIPYNQYDIFYTSLGELRAEMGLHIGIIAVMNGLEIEGDLVKVLPPKTGEKE